ncbi:RNA polymerase sigma factor SigJ [Streptomyces sp. NBC_01619]|uniref:RNA polymerase sigma factor SigJ n=1 Tax=Streptomyces pratisoli TaxID=3139917 RepID=A0ACC6QKE9_9ACTN|nr:MULTISPECIES: RNA polymerase sigma factor SigJ [unclassified Streptomyces]MCX4512278.1 RNA polymerase sigma factor SigJ [Streptomyces sp. NBC_01619]
MTDDELLAQRFEEHRSHLRAVGYRMLGSLSEADDAVQEAWLRLSRSDADAVENLGGWLTTVVGRVCLDMLRSRTSRREDPLDVYVPDPVISSLSGTDPEAEALVTDSVGLAMLVVLDTLAPAERLAFVLHDMFAVPFDEIAPIVGKSVAATRQLASRGRRRVGEAPVPDPDLARQREVVDAWIAASRGGDFDALLSLLDPDVVLRVDGGVLAAATTKLVHGAENVAGQAITYQRFAPLARLALVNGTVGMVAAPEGKALSVMSLAIVGGKVVRIDILTDPERLARLDLAALGD